MKILADEKKLRLLAIETSGPSFSIALSENGRLISEIFWDYGHMHSERLVPELKQLLIEAGWEKAELNKIAVSIGPGSFTGIRVGLTCARVMCQQLEIPLVGVDTLALVGASVPNCMGVVVCPAIDAMRGEVYTRGSSNGQIKIITIVDFCGEVKKIKGKVLVVGNAVETYGDTISMLLKGKVRFAPDNCNIPRAGVLAQMAYQMKGSHYNSVKPLYIRKCWADENNGRN